MQIRSFSIKATIKTTPIAVTANIEAIAHPFDGESRGIHIGEYHIRERKWEISALVLDMRPLGSYLTMGVRKVAIPIIYIDLELGLEY